MEVARAWGEEGMWHLKLGVGWYVGPILNRSDGGIWLCLDIIPRRYEEFCEELWEWFNVSINLK